MMLIVLIIIKNRTQSVFYKTKELNLYLSKTRTELIIRQGARFTSVSHFLLTLFSKLTLIQAFLEQKVPQNA